MPALPEDVLCEAGAADRLRDRCCSPPAVAAISAGIYVAAEHQRQGRIKNRMRTRYSIINMLFNIGGQFLTMLLSFINRMVFIRCLSAEYLGVNGLFTETDRIYYFSLSQADSI